MLNIIFADGFINGKAKLIYSTVSKLHFQKPFFFFFFKASIIA